MLTRDEEKMALTYGNKIVEDLDEKYLYAQNDCTITNFSISPDSCSGHGKLVPQAKKCENFETF